MRCPPCARPGPRGTALVRVLSQACVLLSHPPVGATLVVVHDEHLRVKMFGALQQRGQACWAAQDGFAAARLLRQGLRSDLVLAYEPLQTTGWEFFLRVKARLEPGAPVVLIDRQTAERPERIDRFLRGVDAHEYGVGK